MWAVDSSYSSTASSLDRSPSASLAQVPYDDNDSGHYEAVSDNNDGHNHTDLNSESFYENPDAIRPHRSYSESTGVRGSHGYPFPKRSISCNENETCIRERTDMFLQQSKRVGAHDNRGVLNHLDLIKPSDLSRQIAANAAEVAAHFQRKDENSEKWRPPVAKKNFFSPTSPVKSIDFDKLWRQMENPRNGLDNEFLDEQYKVMEEANERNNSLLSQIQRQRSFMKHH